MNYFCEKIMFHVAQVTHPVVSVVRLALAAGMGVGKDGCLRIPCSPPPGATAMEALRCFLARSNLCGFFFKDDRVIENGKLREHRNQSNGSYTFTATI